MKKFALAFVMSMFCATSSGYAQDLLYGRANSTKPYVYVPPVPQAWRNKAGSIIVFESGKRIANMQTSRGMWGVARNSWRYGQALVPGLALYGGAALSGSASGALLFPKREFIPPNPNGFRGPTLYMPRQMMVNPGHYGLRRFGR